MGRKSGNSKKEDRTNSQRSPENNQQSISKSRSKSKSKRANSPPLYRAAKASTIIYNKEKGNKH